MRSTQTTLPALFVAHGSPMVAIEHDAYDVALARFAKTLAPRPRAVLMISAHWEAGAPLRVTTSATPRTIHDFGGFPDALYQIQYPAPGDPALAAEVVTLLAAAGLDAVGDPARGLDHGAWVPLRFMYPEADVPVVVLSLPVPRAPAELLRIGAALRGLRERGVLIVGSGGLVHNLGRVDFRNKYAEAAPWAREFDAWAAARLASDRPSSLATYRTEAPHARHAVPTSEHFDPALVVLGTWSEGERVTTVHEGFHHGTLSMRSFALAAGGAEGNLS